MMNRMNTDGFDNLERDRTLQDRRPVQLARRWMFTQFDCVSPIEIVPDFFIERCHRMHEGSEVT